MLKVNGKEHRAIVTSEGLCEVGFMAAFRKGINKVVFGSPSVQLSVVDCFQLQR